MADIFMIKMDFIQTMAFAAILYWLGVELCRRLSFLRRYNIPPAVAGGLLFALLRAAASSKVGFQFEMTLMEPFMIAFFTAIGLGASLAFLKKGGAAAFKLLAAACLLLALQNAAALFIGHAAGLSPMLSILAGSATMTGGHGTGIVFANEMERYFGVQGAGAVAVACATFGVIAGSLLGGPVAERLIKKNSLAHDSSDEKTGARDIIAEVFSFGDAKEPISAHMILMTIFQITLAVSVGIRVSEWCGLHGILLPSYAAALAAGMIMRNIGDRVPLFRVHPRVVNYIGGACLSFFLAFALMSVDLGSLAVLAGPLLLILCAQTVITAFFAAWGTFRITGSDYQAAVITAGHVGFGLGATPNAMANMEAVCSKYRQAPGAFFAVAAVGAFFIDIVNVIVINILIRICA
ncbi:MAG: sodium/glutamate symporter [Cloacibacillus sp.]